MISIAKYILCLVLCGSAAHIGGGLVKYLMDAEEGYYIGSIFGFLITLILFNIISNISSKNNSNYSSKEDTSGSDWYEERYRSNWRGKK